MRHRTALRVPDSARCALDLACSGSKKNCRQVSCIHNDQPNDVMYFSKHIGVAKWRDLQDIQDRVTLYVVILDWGGRHSESDLRHLAYNTN
jgi:hypothetical protein